MPPLTRNKKTEKHIKLRKPRCQFNQHITETIDPSHATISSLLLSTVSPNNNENSNNKNKKMGTSFASVKFRGLGCKTAAVAETVSVSAIIRSSADWEVKKEKKKKQQGYANMGYENKKSVQGMLIHGSGCINHAACAVVPDVLWCGPGIGFSAADDAAPVDCVVARKNVGARVKIHVENITSSQREIMIVNDSFITRERRLSMPDLYRAWRLDVDNMTYEELLELGDQIGHVNTGLKEDQISRLLRKFKLLELHDLTSKLPMQLDHKCSICQEEYEIDDEIGKLNCGHGYHIQCIKQWLLQKNACPVCKTAPVGR